MITPTPKPRRKSAREINALMQKMVQLKIIQPGTNTIEEDGSTIYAPTKQFMDFLTEKEERFMTNPDRTQQVIISLMKQGYNLDKIQTVFTPLMIAEYIGGHTDIEVFHLTFKQMEQMADTILKIGEYFKYVTNNK